ncbi:MAG: hypothetical protein PVJ39_05525 [Gammaproteobacteria bacterium]|jgi:hypothetical protein
MIIQNKHRTLIFLACFMVSSVAGAFDAGQSSFAFSAGSGRYFDKSYLALGMGYHYFLTAGWQAGAHVTVWLDGDRDIYQVTPDIKYIYPASPRFQPYLGVFYRRNFIEGEDDIDATGYRAGIYVPAGSGSYFGYGVSYSELKDCVEAVYVDCSVTSSEITFVNTF